ncbi:MAG: glycine--tRNA ligase [Candidatus Liptonbacteria bacterium RIFCSPLOWO2_01_FULL_52_25]|uniref:glycine--tRNA ligase n=1 Tax=Candidatus Liptonbacteria bacterium RIFCSPLOWO2_01_FULL_52_25 TaxID=1798650 RepID=A0A1G2CFL7_9BACT|nr:MAG: glycine--tRNA ligase [Candidatus Liptonbacteria bacterium RIFCSPLOWO2_01_FULL_52_25]
MDKIVSLAKRRGFVYPGSEIYGGLANSWDYGPLGTELKNNIKQLWWKRFVQRRDDMVGIDAALIMNPKVWEASGHLGAGFADALVECKKCHNRFRADQIDSGKPCESCGAKNNFTEPRQFNLMFKTFMGPAEDAANVVYFRPETAQAMFVDFKNVLDTSWKTLPFGIAQVGKAFRNEITPGNFIFRTREFEQMEIEYFVREEEWKKWFEHWQEEMRTWVTKDLGIHKDHVHEIEIPDGERAHYSKRTVDFEYDYPFGRKELYGLAYRTDFDLKNHFKEAPYKEEGGEPFYPHVIEPTWGVDRSVLVTLLDHYIEEGERTYLKLPPKLAPYKAAVFPLLKNKPELVKYARKIYDNLREHFMVAWDDRGNIGKRYYAQDEIGTPFCITVDFDSLGDGDDKKLKDTVTVRNRDTMKQERISVKELKNFLHNEIFG